ncbi:MAG TPA: hypothetical protein VFP77_02135, partial [Gemmatimonadaceae bacterium]|nr:hypothetical protein [Gemmatimonadaceae bacterium]
ACHALSACASVAVRATLVAGLGDLAGLTAPTPEFAPVAHAPSTALDTSASVIREKPILTIKAAS